MCESLQAPQADLAKKITNLDSAPRRPCSPPARAAYHPCDAGAVEKKIEKVEEEVEAVKKKIEKVEEEVEAVKSLPEGSARRNELPGLQAQLGGLQAQLGELLGERRQLQAGATPPSTMLWCCMTPLPVLFERGQQPLLLHRLLICQLSCVHA